jgi:hypothetical protein
MTVCCIPTPQADPVPRRLGLRLLEGDKSEKDSWQLPSLSVRMPAAFVVPIRFFNAIGSRAMWRYVPSLVMWLVVAVVPVEQAFGSERPSADAQGARRAAGWESAVGNGATIVVQAPKAAPAQTAPQPAPSKPGGPTGAGAGGKVPTREPAPTWRPSPVSPWLFVTAGGVALLIVAVILQRRRKGAR